MFKAPLEKLNSSQDLNNWAKEQFDEKAQKDYPARSAEATEQRKHILEYITQQNDAYSESIKLIVFSSMTKGLNEKSVTLPLSLNPRVLADSVEQVQQILKKIPKLLLIFQKSIKTISESMQWEMRNKIPVKQRQNG